MDPIPPWLRTFSNVWDLRLLVLLSLTLQIILTLCGNRRKNTSSRWIRILVWSAYLMADWAATVAFGKLSDTQYENGNALRAIWAPLLLLHLGGPDTITAYSLEDTYLWMRHLLGLGVQFSVALYVILISWRHSWFSIMSIPALVAGLIKYGERTWVLYSVSRYKSGKIVPFGNLGRGSEDKSGEPSFGDSNLGDNNTLGDERSIRALCIAQRCIKEFLKHTEYYNKKFELDKPLNLSDNTLLWEAIEVEMGLVFDVLYTKAPINFTKEGWILRCVTFSCTMAVLIGLILQLTSTQQERLKVDIAITVMLLVGALAMEIYATISLYLFSDWAIFWLYKHNIFRGKRLIRLRNRISWLFLPKQYRYSRIAQFNVLDYIVLDHVDEPAGPKELRRRGLGSLLLGYLKYIFKMLYPSKTETVDIDPCDMCNMILDSRDHLIDFRTWADDPKQKTELRYDLNFIPLPDMDMGMGIASTSSSPPSVIYAPVNNFWEIFFGKQLYSQIFCLHLATEVCYHLEDHWAAARQAMPSSWEDDRKLCMNLSHYMMYLVVRRPSLVPMNVLDNAVWNSIRDLKQYYNRNEEASQNSGSMSVEQRACQRLLDADGSSSEFNIKDIVNLVRKTPKERRWDMLKWVWVKILRDAVAKGQRNEHFRQLSQGGEFITFLWFFLPPSTQRR